jgi:diguanylate cyclase (GGDEF)-like protein/PAS domain S-box-containing protein
MLGGANQRLFPVCLPNVWAAIGALWADPPSISDSSDLNNHTRIGLESRTDTIMPDRRAKALPPEYSLLRRVSVAIGFPLCIALVQWEFWDYIKPLVWFLFYPGIFIAPMIGGTFGGIGATVTSAALVWYLFIPPQYSFALENPYNFISVLVFVMMGTVFSVFHARYHSAAVEAASRNAVLRHEKFLMTITNNIPGMVGYWDSNLVCRFANKMYQEWFGRSVDEMMSGVRLEEMLGEEGWSICRSHVEGVLRGERQSFVRALVKPNGDIGYIRVQFIPDNNGHGKVAGFFSLVTDMTQIREAELRLEEANMELTKLSRTDGLTGALNRRRFDELLETEWVRATRANAHIGLLMIDIDFFKAYNDNHGHSAGDECLRRVVDAVKSVVRNPPDAVARYGGEEFVCLLPGANLQAVEEVGTRVLDSVRESRLPHGFSSVSEHVTVSIGGASIAATLDVDPRSLVKMADDSLYKAKWGGRNQIIIV